MTQLLSGVWRFVVQSSALGPLLKLTVNALPERVMPLKAGGVWDGRTLSVALLVRVMKEAPATLITTLNTLLLSASAKTGVV